MKRAGLWNKADWFPSLVISSRHIGALPESLGSKFDRVDWVPVDLLAEVLIELTLQPDTGQSQSSGHPNVYHPLNPHPTTYTALLPSLLCFLFPSSSTSHKPRTLSLKTWLSRVRASMESKTKEHDSDLATLLEENPAVKLLDFYEGMVAEDGKEGNGWKIGKTVQRSERLRSVEGVKDEWVRNWMGEWFAEGEGKLGCGVKQ